MKILGRRKDGVLLVQDGYQYAVNLPQQRFARLHTDGRADPAFAELSRDDRAELEPAVRVLLTSRRPRLVQLSDVGASMDDVRRMIQHALDEELAKRFGRSSGSYGSMVGPSSGMWVKDIYSEAMPPFFIYCDGEGQHFKWPYQLSPMGVGLIGDPIPVRMVYTDASQSQVQEYRDLVPSVELSAEYDSYITKLTADGMNLSLADQEHPFAHCMETIVPKAKPDDPEGFCAYLVHQATGKWPAQEAKKD
jgi:hypothetical protein